MLSRSPDESSSSSSLNTQRSESKKQGRNVLLQPPGKTVTVIEDSENDHAVHKKGTDTFAASSSKEGNHGGAEPKERED